MKHKLIAAAAAAIFTTTAWAQMGPGMMGPGTMGGYGPGGYGMGPGMMGGYGMGPGMMGGYGMGQGMMGGYGMGPGMMSGCGSGWYAGLGLSDEQRAKIAEIQQDVSRKQWDLMGKMHEQGFHMHPFNAPGVVDESAARKAYQAMSDAHKAMFEIALDARKRSEAVLTKEQLEQLRRAWRGR